MSYQIPPPADQPPGGRLTPAQVREQAASSLQRLSDGMFAELGTAITRQMNRMMRPVIRLEEPSSPFVVQQFQERFLPEEDSWLDPQMPLRSRDLEQARDALQELPLLSQAQILIADLDRRRALEAAEYLAAGGPVEEAARAECLRRFEQMRRNLGQTHLDLSGLGVTALPSVLLFSIAESVQDLSLADNPIRELPEVLRYFRNLETLDLHNTQIESLPRWLGQLPELRLLGISGCDRLQWSSDELPHRCQTVNAIAPPEIPSEESFDDPFLHRMPSMSADVVMRDVSRYQAPDRQVLAGLQAPPNENILEIDRASMMQDPRAVLRRAAALIKRDPAASFRVRFRSEQGFDAGGLRKSLWNDLGRELFSLRPGAAHLLATAHNTNEQKSMGNGWIPVLHEASTESDRHALVDLGTLIGYGVCQNPALLLSHVFDPIIWRALLLRAQHQPDIVVLRELLDESYLNILLKDPHEWTEEDEAIVMAIAENLGCEALPEAIASRFEWTETVRAAVIQRFRYNLEMVELLAQGLEMGSPGILARLQEMGAEQCLQLFQGSITATSFQSALICRALNRLEGLSNPTHYEQAEIVQLRQRMEWFNRWIEHPMEPEQTPTDAEQREEAEQAYRRGLVKAITGREALLAGEQVGVIFVEGQQGPSCHTCFNSIDLPLALDSEEEFRKELRALARLGSSFNAS